MSAIGPVPLEEKDRGERRGLSPINHAACMSLAGRMLRSVFVVENQLVQRGIAEEMPKGVSEMKLCNLLK